MKQADLCIFCDLLPEKIEGGRVVRWCWVNFQCREGWLGGAKVLGKLSVPGRPISLEGVVGWCNGAG